MDKQHLVCRIAGRALIAASLLSVAYATASAQVGPPPVISPDIATLAGTVSVTQLSSSQANREALQAGGTAQPVEMPKFRLPDGSSTSAARKGTVETLPSASEPTWVSRAVSPAPSNISMVSPASLQATTRG